MAQPMRSVDPHTFHESSKDDAPFGNRWIFSIWVLLLVVIGALALADIDNLGLAVTGGTIIVALVHVFFWRRKRSR